MNYQALIKHLLPQQGEVKLKSFGAFNSLSLSRKEWALRCLIIFILAAVFTIVYVSISEKIGRLSRVPTYDDCVYMLDAEFRHFFWQQGGWPAVWKSTQQRTIHAPFSEWLAGVGYMLFGHNDRAPYLANVVVILAYLLTLTWFLRGVSFLPWITSLAIFLSFPIAKLGVMEFRPDIFWGISLAFGAMYVLISPRLLKGDKETLWAGVFFAIAYLVKPSTFALTTVVLFASFGGRLIHAWLMRQEERVTLKEALHSTAIIGVVLLSLAGWYYMAFGAHVWNYFYENSFGANKHIWSTQGNWWHWMRYYLDGDGSINTLGDVGRKVLLIMATLLLWKFFVDSPSEKLRCFLIGSIGVLIYAVITLGSMKNPYVGASLHMFTIFITAYLLNWFFLQFSLLFRRLATGGLIIFAIMAALIFKTLPSYRDLIRPASMRGDTHSEATNAVSEILQSMKIFPKSIVFIQTAPVMADTVYMRLLRRSQNPEIIDLSWHKTMEEVRAAQKNKDMIVVPDLRAKGTIPFLPIVAFMPDILKELATNPNFSLYHTIQTSDGSLIYVYLRKGYLALAEK